MIRDRMWKAAVFTAAVVLSFCTAYGQSPVKLSARDYMDIENLTAGYTYLIDNCTNSGYDYADQYTDDGTFGVASDWGATPKIWYRGHEQLAEADGGGKGGCHQRPAIAGMSRPHHIVTSQVIIPTAVGAYGRSTLLLLSAGNPEHPPRMEWQGGYEDTYVKTPKGWRFKTRVHTWPGHQWPDTAAEQEAIFAKQRAAREAAQPK